MPSQWRNDQSGGGQATGKTAQPTQKRSADGPVQTDNGTKAGTEVPKLKQVPGV